MSYVTPEEIDRALGALADHCVVPRDSHRRNSVLDAFGTISRAGRELREAIELNATSDAQ